MESLTARSKLLVAGVAIGVAYGLVTRLVFGEQATLASVTYLLVTPTILGAVPLMFASDTTLRSYKSLIFLPWVTVVGLALTLAAVRLEGVMCLVILAAPFVLLGTLGAFVYRLLRMRARARRAIAPALLLFPFLLSPLEQAIESPSRVYRVASNVVVRAPADVIWANVIRVAEITPAEYTPGVFHRLGIPRPIEAELLGEGPASRRIGHFEGGLEFAETITEWMPHRRVAFSIEVAPETVRRVVFDQHVLRGSYFKFIDAAYEIEPVGGGAHRLRLISRYRLTSKVNLYGKLWGDAILEDFQDRLLAVIRARCESAVRLAARPGSTAIPDSAAGAAQPR
jgi:hypothetical protein